MRTGIEGGMGPFGGFRGGCDEWGVAGRVWDWSGFEEAFCQVHDLVARERCGLVMVGCGGKRA